MTEALAFNIPKVKVDFFAEALDDPIVAVAVVVVVVGVVAVVAVISDSLLRPVSITFQIYDFESVQ